MLSLNGAVQITVVLPNGNASTDADILYEQTLRLIRIQDIFCKGSQKLNAKNPKYWVAAVQPIWLFSKTCFSYCGSSNQLPVYVTLPV